MADKININKATKKELTSIKGIADVTADRILNFREKGGVINSLDDLQKISKIRPNYLNELTDVVDFEDGRDDGNPKKETPSAQDLTVEPLFRIQFPDIPSDEGENPYAGYRVVVGYKLWRSGVAGMFPTSHTKKFSIAPNGIVEVHLTEEVGTYLGKSFDIFVNSPKGEPVYKKTDITLEDSQTIKIDLPFSVNNNLLVKLEKQQGINYNGYTLKAYFYVDRGSSSLDVIKEEFDISFQDEILIKSDPFEGIVEVDLKVMAPNEVLVTRSKYKWKEIEETEEAKQVHISLPRPSGLSYSIQLIVDIDSLENPYLDHSLIVLYNILRKENLQLIRRIEERFPIDSNGLSHVNIEHYGLVQELELEVKAPAGEVIGRKTLKATESDDDGKVQVKVLPRKLAGAEGIHTIPERPEKITGRLIDAQGKKKLENIQIIIYASTVEGPAEKDFFPLQFTRSETEGYFVMDMPKLYFTGAFARIGLSTNNHPTDVPVRLEKDRVWLMKDEKAVMEEKLFFPANMILVVQAEDEEKKKETCSECETQNYLRPKKAVDEFSFYTVVRTTEPDIQGYTFEEDGEVSVQNIIDIVPLASDRTHEEVSIPASYLHRSIRKNVLMKHVNNKKGLTLTTLKKALNESNAQKLREKIKPRSENRAIGRHNLNLNTSIDWDKDPTIYQATSIAHGHLLQYKQEWLNDGYSTGDLLYSLPLAPGQKKQIVVFDWERRESATRRESLDYQESLYNSLSRDRDVNEVVQGSLRENIRGGSSARTSSASGGFGLGFVAGPVGGLLGVSGGSSKASSTAWQDSSRHTTLSDLQQLRDRTLQSANAIRSQRASVITTATQGERFSAETETVANYNRCHSLTIQYFEVLRHLKVQQRLASVQECLFIPLMISHFDYQKILRWQESLSSSINRRLQRGFGAIQRIENDYEGSDLPENRFADDNLEYLEGGIYIKFEIPAPQDLSILEEKEELLKALERFMVIVPSIQRHLNRIVDAKIELRNELFYEHVAPEIAAAFIEKLKIEAVVQSGTDGVESEQILPLSTTMVTRFENGKPLFVSLRQNGSIGPLRRSEIKAVVIRKASGIMLQNGESLADVLPVNSQIMITSGTIRYNTAHFSGHLFRNSNIMDDLVGYSGLSNDREKVRIATPLSRAEMRNPRNEDLEIASALQDHLNDNVEKYHSAIWMNMSAERRFMFLDGIRITDYSDVENYPQGVIRSVASVVENRVIGIIGNNLVMPVAPGFRLDPNTRGKEVDLFSLYQPLTPAAPASVSIPTKGVYAEAVMGQCNSCEKINEDRFWRWSEEPIPHSPTPIMPVSTDTRRTTPADTDVTSFPNPMVNIQNAPQAPNPQGFGAAAELLGNASFRDITGLQGNQANAIKALQATMEAAQKFGTQASGLTALGAQLDAIREARRHNMIPDDLTRELSEKAIRNFYEEKPDQTNSGLNNIKRLQEMIERNDIPGDIGQELMKNLTKSMHKNGGTENLRDLLTTGGEKIPSVGSFSAETTTPEGKLTKLTMTGSSPTSSFFHQQKINQLVECFQRNLHLIKTNANVLKIALEEEKGWTDEDGNKIKEGDKDDEGNFIMLNKLTDYFKAIPEANLFGHNSDPEEHAKEAAKDNNAWSAAFICYVFAKAGIKISDGFEFSNRHITYIVHALMNRLNKDQEKIFWLYRVDERTPQPGDLVCVNRPGGGTWNFNNLRNDFLQENNEGKYEINPPIQGNSHCDIVLGTKEKDGVKYLETMGGNLSDTILRVDVRLNEDGKIDMETRNDEGEVENRNYFGILGIEPCNINSILADLSGESSPVIKA
ncbi:DUF2272 domain-containing protein [Cytophagaceae bacterium ABcell3]|nr:DUF2272 domain-containing protein [Cytophagaceae bacterium ABcell3]